VYMSTGDSDEGDCHWARHTDERGSPGYTSFHRHLRASSIPKHSITRTVPTKLTFVFSTIYEDPIAVSGQWRADEYLV
jgi:hypothetical protein